MTSYKRGDIVLVSFIFSDETGAKQRPALIVSADTYNNARQEIIISAITSRTGRILTGDYLVKNWKAAGLLAPSVITGIVRTIKQSMIVRKLGTMSSSDLKEIDKNLMVILRLV